MIYKFDSQFKFNFLSDLKRVILLIALTICSVTLFAQSRTITGQISSDFGLSISGVKIKVKNGNTQSSSDEQGHFTITIPDDKATLSFKMEGYEDTEISVGKNEQLNVVMPVNDLTEMSLEDLMNIEIASSSFFSLKSKDTPGYVFRQDMSKIHAPKSLYDIIKMVTPGTSDGNHRETELMGVRGMKVVDNSKTLVMFDGQSLNQRAKLGYSLGFSNPLLGDVKSIEVGLSPNAIVHGSGAINGYINMIPKNGFDNAGVTATATNQYEGTSFGENFVNRFDIGYGFGSSPERNVYLYAGWYQNQGYTPDSSLTMNENSTIKMADEQLNLAENLDQTLVGNTYQPNIKLSSHLNYDNFSLNVGYQQNWQSSYLNTLQNFQRILNIRPKYNLKLTETESVDVIASAEWYDLGILYSDAVAPYTSGGNEKHHEGKVVFKTTRLKNNSLALGVLMGNRTFKTQEQFFGSDLDFKQTQYFINPETGKNVEDESFWATGQIPEGKWNETAIFIEDIYKVTEKLTVSGGLRYDSYYIEDLDDTQNNIAPRIAAGYALNDNSTLKLSYQQGFRTIDLYNIYQTMYNRVPQLNNANSVNNKLVSLDENYNPTFDKFSIEIEPEKLESYEISYHLDLLDKKLSIDANGYYNIYKNTIDYIPLVRWSTAKYLEDPTYRGDIQYPGAYFTDEALYNWVQPSSGNLTNANYTREKGMAVNIAEDINIIGSELIVNYQPVASTQLRAIYGFSKSLDEDYQNSSTFPSHQLKLSGTQYLFNNKLMLNSLLLFEPGLEKTAIAEQNYHDIYFTDRAVLDFTVKYQFHKNASVSLSGTNILGENNPGLLFKPVPSTTSTNTSTEYLGLGKDQRKLFLTFKFTL